MYTLAARFLAPEYLRTILVSKLREKFQNQPVKAPSCHAPLSIDNLQLPRNGELECSHLIRKRQLGR